MLALLFILVKALLSADDTQIYANCVIEERSKIGKGGVLYPNVSVYHDCSIGDRVILHSGCCIGADGFGFAPRQKVMKRYRKIGNVIIRR